MPRWDPRAKDRLRDAALELYLEHGYENVTVAQITERAGLTRRTFSRYFTDKRDVLFDGSEQLAPALADAVRRADAALPPFQALLAALTEVGDLLAASAPHAAQRRAVVQASPELQERGRTKFAAVTDALRGALEERGMARSGALMLAQVGVAIFQAAFERWTDEPERADFSVRIREAAAELAASLETGAPCLSPEVPELSRAQETGREQHLAARAQRSQIELARATRPEDLLSAVSLGQRWASFASRGSARASDTSA